MRVPPQVTERKIFHLNKGRIHTADAPPDIMEAYHEQFVNDMEIFLNARAAELGAGGLMDILIPSTPRCSKSIFDMLVQLLECALMGLVSSVSLCNTEIYFSCGNRIIWGCLDKIHKRGNFTTESYNFSHELNPVTLALLHSFVVI